MRHKHSISSSGNLYKTSYQHSADFSNLIVDGHDQSLANHTQITQVSGMATAENTYQEKGGRGVCTERWRYFANSSRGVIEEDFESHKNLFGFVSGDFLSAIV